MKKLRNWGQLQTVLAVARGGSYRAAGEELGITSSTVARHIEAVSEEIGHAVFVPKDNKWELTEAGKELFEIADKTQAKIGFMIKNLDDSGGLWSSLQISTLSFISSDFLAKSVHLWKQDNPHAKLIIDATDEITAIERGGADIALRLSRPDIAGTSRFKVANCFVGLFAPQGSSQTDWVGLSSDLDDLHEMQMAADHFGCGPALRFDSFKAIAEAAIATGMPCILPTCLAREYAQLDQVRSKDAPMVINRELWCLFYEKRQHDPAILAAKKWVRQVFTSSSKCLCGQCFPD